jgi:hypothetical protein
MPTKNITSSKRMPMRTTDMEEVYRVPVPSEPEAFPYAQRQWPRRAGASPGKEFGMVDSHS